MNDSFKLWCNTHQKRIENFLEDFLKKNSDQSLIKEVCKYAIFGNGKRIRALLVYAIGEINGAEKKELDYIAGAIELIHCYSLIHDDLPAMDDDDLRRGKASCHKEFNEAQAILAGDAIQALSFSLLSSDNFKISDNKKIEIIKIFSRAIGIQGMVLGQSMDIQSTNKKISLEMIENLQKLKTGILIEASCVIPNLISKIDNNSKILVIAKLLGQIYQITDDILDNESNSKLLGKKDPW